MGKTLTVIGYSLVGSLLIYAALLAIGFVIGLVIFIISLIFSFAF